MKPIRNYIQQKRKEGYCGSIKLSFENGRVVTVNEANRFDVITDSVKDEAGIEQSILSQVSDPSYNGSVVIVMSCGTITEYGYLRTYKGQILDRLLEGCR